MIGLLSRADEPLGRRLPGVSHWDPADPPSVGTRHWAGRGAQLVGTISADAQDDSVCVGSARVDNRAELLGLLGLDYGAWGGENPTGPGHGDIALIHAAYRRWGADCVRRIFGDWSFALWHPDQRRLFLARDHFGNTSLYYYCDGRTMAFSSDRRVLLDLNLAPIELDDLYVAQVLVSWPAYHGEGTAHRPIRRLPPAHTLTVTAGQFEVRQYWFLEQTPTLRLRDRREYVEGFREVFDEAVRVRLRRAGAGSVGSTLSGGLDSSSVTATAAGMLQDSGEQLAAFTSVPIADTTPYVGTNFGDELPFARATARRFNNVDLHQIRATDFTPIEAIRQTLPIHEELGHAAGNMFWMLSLNRAASAMGCSVLLTGQLGNAGISWTGSTFSQPLRYQLRTLGVRSWTRQRLKRTLPPSSILALRGLRRTPTSVEHTALNPDLADRLDLDELRRAAPDQIPPRTSLDERSWLQPGRSFIGALHAQSGRAAGLEIRDPSGDARVLAYTWSVPDEVFIDPVTGMDRWLIRDAMVGRLPEEVRLNRRRGRQAGDLVVRLRDCADEVETALAEIEDGPGADYVDCARLRSAWDVIQTEDTARAFHWSVTILTRGIMGGLFVNSHQNWDTDGRTSPAC